jgi:predicted dinucleotide-binding enzyme
VAVASRRRPEALAPQARAIGPTVVAKSLQHAVEADTIILAIPFGEHREVAKVLPSWKGKTVIDATNPSAAQAPQVRFHLVSECVAKPSLAWSRPLPTSGAQRKGVFPRLSHLEMIMDL